MDMSGNRKICPPGSIIVKILRIMGDQQVISVLIRLAKHLLHISFTHQHFRGLMVILPAHFQSIDLHIVIGKIPLIIHKKPHTCLADPICKDCIPVTKDLRKQSRLLLMVAISVVHRIPFCQSLHKSSNLLIILPG